MPVSTYIKHPVSFIYPDNFKSRTLSVKHECLIIYLLIINLYIVMYCVLFVLNPFLHMFAKLAIVTVTFVVSICLSVHLFAQYKLAPTRQIFMKSDVQVFFENVSRVFSFDYNLTRITGTSLEDMCTFMVPSC